MDETTIEDRTAEFLQAAVDDAEDGDTLFGAEVHDTAYSPLGEFGYRIWDCTSDAAPLPGGEGMDEFDACFMLVAFAKVAGPEASDRKAARSKARSLTLAACKLFFDDTTMGDRVSDVLAGRFTRGFDVEEGEVYAVANIPLTVNGTGQLLDNDERY